MVDHLYTEIFLAFAIVAPGMRIGPRGRARRNRLRASVGVPLTLPQLRSLVALHGCGPIKLVAMAATLGRARAPAGGDPPPGRAPARTGARRPRPRAPALTEAADGLDLGLDPAGEAGRLAGVVDDPLNPAP